MEEEYFIDERPLNLQKYKINVIRTITEEEMHSLDRKKEAITQLSNKASRKIQQNSVINTDRKP